MSVGREEMGKNIITSFNHDFDEWWRKNAYGTGFYDGYHTPKQAAARAWDAATRSTETQDCDVYGRFEPAVVRLCKKCHDGKQELKAEIADTLDRHVTGYDQHADYRNILLALNEELRKLVAVH